MYWCYMYDTQESSAVTVITQHQVYSRPALCSVCYVPFITLSVIRPHQLTVGTVAVQSDCLKGRVVCGTVYEDMHLKDLLGSIVRVRYRIPVPDFYLVLHGLRCRKSTIMIKPNQTNQKILQIPIISSKRVELPRRSGSVMDCHATHPGSIPGWDGVFTELYVLRKEQ